ncbi:MAG: protein disulfide oxidoreductase [Candidatus Micrarchaeia archaeon]
MEFIKNEDKIEIKKIFDSKLVNDVNIMVFTSKDKSKCMYCSETVALLKELSALSSKLKVTEYDIVSNAKEAKFMGIDKVPAIVLGGKIIYNMYYFGIPTGYEFASLLEDIIDVSTGQTRLSAATKEALKKFDKPIDIKIFVTPTCPWCPKAVRTAHQFTLENNKIKSSMIEATEFPDLSQDYGVMAVPKIVINDKESFEGAQPEEVFLEYIRKA